MKPTMAHKTTSEETMMHILKANIGTGILAMPSAFSHVGLAIGSLGIPVLGFVCTHCMYILVTSQQVLSKKCGEHILTYEGVAEKSVLYGPKVLRRYAHLAKCFVAAFLLLTQTGICCVYSLFVAENLRKVAINTDSLGSYSATDVRIYLLFLLPFMILLNWIRSMKHLAILSTCANVLQISGLLVICYNLTQDLPPSWSRPVATTLSQFPLYFSTAIFAFEGIAVIMPIFTAMKKPETFQGYFGVLNTGMTLVTILYVTIGFYGYLKFGDKAAGSITLNLPAEPLYEVVRLMFTLALFLSYPLQMYVPFNILWPWIADRFPKSSSKLTLLIAELVYRAILVSITFILAGVVPLLELVISLVGAMSSSAIAVIFPPLVQILVLWEDRDQMSSLKWAYIVTKDLFVTFVGIFGLITGTYYSIEAIVNEISKTY